MRVRAAVVLMAIVAFGAGESCVMKQSANTAQAAVDAFHARLNAEQYVPIFVEADEALKKTTTQDEFVAFLAAIHRELGEHRTSTFAGSRVFVGVQGVEVTLGFDSDYAEGKATEQFTWRVAGQRAALINFTINSPVFVLK
jgi:hypothetical protein